MFGYVPTGSFAMTEEQTEGVPIPRTKERAYMIAVWAGHWGAHQFFLNNSPAGLLHWVALSTLVWLPARLGFWPGLGLAFLLNAGLWLYAIYAMAVMPEDDPRLQGHTSADYAERMIWFCTISLWGIDFWKKARAQN